MSMKIANYARHMIEQHAPKLSLWPFVIVAVIGDAVLYSLAWWIAQHSPAPLALWPLSGMIFCVFAGAGLSLAPFGAAYRANARLAEIQALAGTVAQIQQMDHVAAQINSATAQWQVMQDHANKSVAASGQVMERMTTEAKAFSEFMLKANDAEKAHLRLEVEKLRRGEAEWLQVVVRVFDHIFAIYQAGARSQQPAVCNQLGQFQNACREVIRRVGLTPFEVPPGEAFNPELHNLVDQEAKPPANALVAETLATGFTFQGQLIRPALVALQPVAAAEPAPGAAPAEEDPPIEGAS